MGKLIAVVVGLIGGYVVYQSQLPPGYSPGTFHSESIDNQTLGIAVVAGIVGLVLIFKAGFDMAKTLGVALVASAFSMIGLVYYVPDMLKQAPAPSAPAAPAITGYRPLTAPPPPQSLPIIVAPPAPAAPPAPKLPPLPQIR